MEKKFYTQITVKTFCTDEDGMVISQKFKSAMIAAPEDIFKLGETVGKRAKAIVEENMTIIA